MKVLKNIITVCVLCASIIGFTACEKVEIGKNIPKCIEKKIKKEANNSCLSFIEEYIYTPKGYPNKIQSRIYRFTYGPPFCTPSPDDVETYYDEKCNRIDVIVVELSGVHYSFIEYDRLLYCFNRYVYQPYIKK